MGPLVRASSTRDKSHCGNLFVFTGVTLSLANKNLYERVQDESTIQKVQIGPYPVS